MRSESYNKALSRAMALCSKSEKCRYDVENKLNSWGITGQEENRDIIQDLISNGFLDEKRYAVSFTRDKFRFNRWGKTKIRAILRSKGLDENDIDAGLDEIDETEYLQMIENELAAKRKSVRGSNLFDLKGKLFRFASSRGYEKEPVYEILDKMFT